MNRTEIRLRNLSNALVLVMAMLVVTARSVAQEGLTIRSDAKHSSPIAEQFGPESLIQTQLDRPYLVY